MRLRPRRSALLHELTEECGLLVAPGEHGRNGLGQLRRVRWFSLVAPGEHGRNGLGQLRRVRWFSHSAFNHDKVSSIIRIN